MVPEIQKTIQLIYDTLNLNKIPNKTAVIALLNAYIDLSKKYGSKEQFEKIMQDIVKNWDDL